MDWTDNYNTIMNAEGFGMSKKQSMAIDFSGQQAPAPWLWQWRVHGSGKEPYRVSVKAGAAYGGPTGDQTKPQPVWGCTCPASRFMADGERTCKHVLRLHLEMLQNPLSFINVPESVRMLVLKAAPQGLTMPAKAGTLPIAANTGRRIKVIQ